MAFWPNVHYLPHPTQGFIWRFFFLGGGGGGGMGWCGVGGVIRESIDLSEYPCEYARPLPTGVN